MNWTAQVPTVPGFYWFRELGRSAVVVEVILSGTSPRLFVSFTQGLELLEIGKSAGGEGAEWYGPLTAPE